MSKPPTVADRLRQARAARGMSQSALAKGLKLTRGAVGQWETDVTSPNMDNLRSAAVLLQVEVDWLASGRGKGPGAGAQALNNPQDGSPVTELYASASHEEAWVFPSSFIQEAARATATRLVTVEVQGPNGPTDRTLVEVTIVGRAPRATRST
jgi:transcriptional regulator with XRE-family HTH domain